MQAIEQQKQGPKSSCKFCEEQLAIAVKALEQIAGTNISLNSRIAQEALEAMGDA